MNDDDLLKSSSIQAGLLSYVLAGQKKTQDVTLNCIWLNPTWRRIKINSVILLRTFQFIQIHFIQEQLQTRYFFKETLILLSFYKPFNTFKRILSLTIINTLFFKGTIIQLSFYNKRLNTFKVITNKLFFNRNKDINILNTILTF